MDLPSTRVASVSCRLVVAAVSSAAVREGVQGLEVERKGPGTRWPARWEEVGGDRQRASARLSPAGRVPWTGPLRLGLERRTKRSLKHVSF